jgi:hypothetical protein
MRSRRLVQSAPVANAAGVSFGALADEWGCLERIAQDPGESDESWDARVDTATDRQAQIVREATATPAATPRDVADKLRLAAALLQNGCDYPDRRDVRLIESAERDLRALANA